MTEFLEFTSVVTYRVPIKEDGTLGKPQILKRFTTESTKKNAGKTRKKTKKKSKTATLEMGDAVSR